MRRKEPRTRRFLASEPPLLLFFFWMRSGNLCLLLFFKMVTSLWVAAQARDNLFLRLYVPSQRRSLLLRGARESAVNAILMAFPLVLFHRLITVAEVPPHWHLLLAGTVGSMALLWWRVPRAVSVLRRLIVGFVRSHRRMAADSPEVRNAEAVLQVVVSRTPTGSIARRIHQHRRTLSRAIRGTVRLSRLHLFVILEEVNRLQSAAALKPVPVPVTAERYSEGP